LLMKLNPNRGLIWSKRVTSEDGAFYPRGLAPRPEGWTLIGNTFKMQLLRSWTKYGSHTWDTYYISLTTSEGEIEHEFDGDQTRFIVTDIIETTVDSWAITGYGKDGTEKDFPMGEKPVFDIGILHYKYSPTEN